MTTSPDTSSPLDRIPDLAAWLAEAGLDELELHGPDGHVCLRRGGNGHSRPPHPEVSGEAEPRGTRNGLGAGAGEVVTSPGIGHVLHAHPLRTAPLARPGDAVTAGQPLCLLRIGMVLVAIPAPRDGLVAKVIAPDGTLVGYGDSLLALRPAT